MERMGALSHDWNQVSTIQRHYRDRYILIGQSSPGNLHFGQVPSNCTRQIPQSSSSGMSQRQAATAWYERILTFIFLTEVWYKTQVCAGRCIHRARVCLSSGFWTKKLGPLTYAIRIRSGYREMICSVTWGRRARRLHLRESTWGGSHRPKHFCCFLHTGTDNQIESRGIIPLKVARTSRS